jgi:Ca-activated chloride channel family protein
VCALLLQPVFAADKEDENKKAAPPEDEIVVLSAFSVASFGATPGGFQDINYGRDLLELGMLPHESKITAEGLFSEFDLPTPSSGQAKNLLEITGDAKAATIMNKPGVTHLAQIGFESGLDPRTWKRDPLLLVVVADVSGSMGGSMVLLQKTIHEIMGKLGPEDALALVSFSDDARIEFDAVRTDDAARAAMQRAINALTIRGGTDIEAGLKTGFDIALNAMPGYKGRRRVLLITDAMPNINETDPDGFMALAEAASLKGAGLTTIGVGLAFDADFTRRVSSVSGGNAFYFPDAKQMRKRVSEDFDFLVTELAHDMHIEFSPAAGFRVADVYGLPGDVYKKTDAGGMVMDLPTLFLSREKGAIFLSLESNGMQADAKDADIGNVRLSYVEHGNAEVKESRFALSFRRDAKSGAGLARGAFLINEYEALRAASHAFYGNGDLTIARMQVQALCEWMKGTADRALKKEARMLENLRLFLDVAAEIPALDAKSVRAKPGKSPLLGIWHVKGDEDNYCVFMPGGRISSIHREEKRLRTGEWKGAKISLARHGEVTLLVKDGELVAQSKDGGGEFVLERCDPKNIWRSSGR